jgi:hypothetical protein
VENIGFADIIYRIFFFTAFLYSLPLLHKSDRSLQIFPFLLFIGNLIEAFVIVIKTWSPVYPILYHVYIPLEYSFLAYFFSLNIPNEKVQKGILITIPLFVIYSFLLTCFFYSFKLNQHPSIQFNTEGILLIVFTLVSFFTSKEWRQIPIYKSHLFWFNSGLLIFYSGNFLLMALYNYFKEDNIAAASFLWTAINTSLNIALYIFFIFGFLCLRQPQKQS